MAVTLAQARLNVTDDLQRGIIDEFAKNNYLLNHLTFHDCVSPVGGGGTLTYAYTRLITQPTAAFRKVNAEYNPSEVKKQRETVDLKVFGGSFEIDRVIKDMGGIVDEVQLQSSQKVKAAQALFNDTVINGDSSQNEDEFDGLNVMLTGTNTEKTSTIDLSTSALVDANYMAFLDEFDEFLTSLNGRPDALLMNAKMAAKLRAVARRAGMYQTTKDSWGNQVESYGVIPFIDLGAKSGSNEDVIATADGKSDIYAVRFGMDGFHAISLAGQAPIKMWLPNFSESGAVKKGEVEMVAAVALKDTRSAGVLRGIKIA